MSPPVQDSPQDLLIQKVFYFSLSFKLLQTKIQAHQLIQAVIYQIFVLLGL